MKKQITIVATILILGGCAMQSAISTSDVPTSVITNFQQKYPNTTVSKWKTWKKDNKVYYEAKFTQNGKKIEAVFLPDGAFVKEE